MPKHIGKFQKSQKSGPSGTSTEKGRCGPAIVKPPPKKK